MGSIPVFALTGLAAIVTGVRFYRLRKSTQRPALLALGSLAAGAAIGWLALPIARYGGYLLLVLVPVCFAAGRLVPEYLFGAAVSFAVFGLPAGWMAIVILPVTAGYATVIAEKSHWMLERQYNNLLKRDLEALIGEGSPPLRRLLPPGWLDRAQLPAGLAAGMIPLVAGVLADGGPLVTVSGLLVSASFEFRIWGIRGLTRSFRRTAVQSMLLRAAIIVLVAASPAGAWVASAVSGSLPEAPIWPVLVALAVLCAGLAIAGRGRGQEQRIVRPHNRLIILLATAGGLLEDGLFPFFTGGIFHPQRTLLIAGAVLAGGNFLFTAFQRLVVGIQPLMNANQVELLAGVFGDYDDIQGWLYDSVLARPRKPDLTLLSVTVRDATRAPHGGANLAHEMFGPGRRSLRVDDSLRWLKYVEHAVDMLEEGVLPRMPADSVELLCPKLAVLRASCAGARANLYGYVNLREEAASAYQQAVEIYEQADLGNDAALARVGLALVTGMRLRRQPEAIALLETVLDDESVESVIRRRGCQIAMIISREFDDETAVAAYRRRRDLLSASRRDYDAAVASTVWEVGGLFAHWRSVRGMANLFQTQELFFDAASPRGTVPMPIAPSIFPVPERELLSAGQLLAAEGKTRRALQVLEDAARLAETQGHTEYVLRSRNAIAGIHLDHGDRAEALRNLSAAISAQQHIRTLAIDPEVRGDVGGLYSETFERAIDLLVSAGPQPSEGWPGSPAASAFDLSELARSRVFLELLGERLAPRSDGERTAREALEAARQQLKDSAGTNREQRLADVRAAARALDAYYERRQTEDPGTAEYIALRRGTPITYHQIRRLLETADRAIPAIVPPALP